MYKLKINSLPPNALDVIDSDILMLHSCFQILEDSVKDDAVDKQCNYKEHKEFVDEVRFLYKWWIKRKISDGNDDEDDTMLLRLMKIRGGLWI